jgi:hypothetical protein
VLNGLESKLTGLVAAALAGRDGLTVEQVAGPESAPAAGAGTVRVALTGLGAEAVFDPGWRVVAGGNGEARSRRVLPVRFAAVLRFARRPAEGADPAAVAAAAVTARRLMLEDLSLTSHALAEERVRSGAAFAVAGDPGFEVRAFSLGAGTVATEPVDGLLRAELACDGQAILWPPGPPEEVGEIEAVATDVEPGEP